MNDMIEYIQLNQREIISLWKNSLSLTCSEGLASLEAERKDYFLEGFICAVQNKGDLASLFWLAQQWQAKELSVSDLLFVFRRLQQLLERQLKEERQLLQELCEAIDHTFGQLAEALLQVKEIGFMRQEKELKILRELNQVIRETMSTQDMLKAISTILVRNVQAKSIIMLLDKTGRELQAKAISGLQHRDFKTLKLGLGEGVIGKSVHDRTTLLARHVATDPRIRHRGLLQAERIGCLLSIPLYNKQKVIGAIGFLAHHEKDLRSEGIGFLVNISNHIGIALEKSILYEDIYENYLYTIKALIAAIDAKDNYTRGHSERVMEYAVIISKTLEIPENEIDDIKFAALLHDIGKIGIEETILRKPGRLTEIEFKVISEHPQIGVNILGQVDYLRNLVPAVRHHHERFSGGGYPDGISGEKIPLAARILSVADSLDAMTFDRPYRRAFSIDQALNELVRCSGTQFDPMVVAALLQSVGRQVPDSFVLNISNQ